MRREQVRPREDWVARVEAIGFDFHTIDAADHHLVNHIEELEEACEAYLDKRLKPTSETIALAR